MLLLGSTGLLHWVINMNTKEYTKILRTKVPSIVKPLTLQYQQLAIGMLKDKEKYKKAINPNLDDAEAIITIIYTLGMLR